MAWTAPKTWAAADILTADDLNIYLRDNLLETMPAKALDEGSYFTTSLTNEITARLPVMSRVAASESTASTSYVDLDTVGPSVTFESGACAFVFHGCRMENDTANAQSNMSWAISGATTRAALDITRITMDGLAQAGSRCTLGSWDLLTDLTPGTNTITAQYRAGGAGTGIFSQRFLCVLPL